MSARDSAILSKLDLGNKVGTNFSVTISVFKNGVNVGELKLDIRDNKSQGLTTVAWNAQPNPPKVIDTVKTDTTIHPIDTTKTPGPVIPVKPKLVTWLTSSPLNLAVGSPATALKAMIDPGDAEQAITYFSKNPSIAQITNDQLVAVAAGKTQIIAYTKSDTTIKAVLEVETIIPVQVDSVRITPKTLSLFSGGAASDIAVKVFSNDPSAKAQVRSSDASTVRVENNKAYGLKEGSARLYAEAVGYLQKVDSCLVTVKRDPPQLAASGDQNILNGGTAKFTLTITQEYGLVAMLKWDLDGDGNYDDSIASKSSHEVSKVYPKEGEYKITFYVRDSEGNVELVTRRVLVGSTAPFVDITSPSKDTLVNKTPLLIRFVVDGVPAESTVVLSERKLSYSINGTKIEFSAANNWTLPGVSFPDADVKIQIYAEDNAGNSKQDSIIIYKKSNVVFVRPSGTGNGESWANATNSLESAIQTAQNKPNGEVWATTGYYSGTDQYSITKPVKIYGGFISDGTGTSVNSRSSTSNLSTISSSYIGVSSSQEVILDRMLFSQTGFSVSGKAQLTDCRFQATLNDVYTAIRVDGTLAMYGGSIKGMHGVFGAIEVGGSGRAEFSGVEISGNVGGWAGALYVHGGSAFFKDRCILKNNKTSANITIPANVMIGQNGVLLSIVGCDIQGGQESIQSLAGETIYSGNTSVP